MRVLKHRSGGPLPRSDTTIVCELGLEGGGSHCAGAVCTRCGTASGQTPRHVRSDGSVLFAGVRMSGDSWANIYDEHAVMMPTQRNVA